MARAKKADSKHRRAQSQQAEEEKDQKEEKDEKEEEAVVEEEAREVEEAEGEDQQDEASADEKHGSGHDEGEGHQEDQAAAASTGGGKRKAVSAGAAGVKKRRSDDDGDGDGHGDGMRSVLSYMRRANRPFTNTVVFDNLHGAIKKPQIIRILDELAAKSHQTDTQQRTATPTQHEAARDRTLASHSPTLANRQQASCPPRCHCVVIGLFTSQTS
jgi:TBPIP/Hop2 winged helix domain